jgi:Predicted membrane protein
MNIPFGVLNDAFFWLTWLLAVPLLLLSLWRAPWHKVLNDWTAQAVFAGAVLIVLGLWSVKASIGPGLSFHFLGATLLTLMFGWQFAFIALAFVLALVTYTGGAGWDAFAANWLTLAAVPVLVTWWALLAAYRWLPRNFFVYVFLNAFLVGALAMLASILALTVVLVWGDVISWLKLSYQFLPLLPMMMGPEAFVNGFLITILVMNKVEWVSTFTDEQYLHGK